MLAAEGWRLVLAARSIGKLDALAEELGGPDRAVAVECDVTEWADQQAAVTVALEHYGRLDAAWANAGFGGAAGLPRGDTVGHWREMVLDERLRRRSDDQGCDAGAQGGEGAPSPDGLGRRASCRFPARSTPRRSTPCTRWASPSRQELDGTGVRVTVIAPGMVDTPFFAEVPLDAPLEPGDIARAVLFAVSQPPHVDVNEILVRPTAQPH